MALLSFSQLEPSATLEVEVGKINELSTIKTAQLVEIGNREVSAQLRVIPDVAQIGRTSFSSEVKPGWRIEEVISHPTGVNLSWQVDKQPDLQRLHVQFDHTADAAEDFYIKIRGTRARGQNENSFTIGNLTMCQDANAEATTNLMAIRSDENSQVQLQQPQNEDDAAEYVEWRNLFPKLGDDLVVDIAQYDQDTVVTIVPRDDLFVPDLNIELYLGPQNVSATYLVKYSSRPESGKPLVVGLFPPITGGLQWWESNQYGPVIAQPSNPATSLSSSDGVQWWELPADSPSVPNTLTAKLDLPWNGDLQIPLLFVPAKAGAVRVTIRRQGDRHHVVRETSLARLAIPHSSAWSDEFRYDPALDGRTEARPSLTLVDADSGFKSRTATIPWMNLTSFLDAGHRTTHVAECEILGARSTAVDLRLPDGSQLVRATIDEVNCPLDQLLQDRTPELVSIPLEGSSTTVRLRYATPGESVLNWKSVASPLPLEGPPILAGRWSVVHPAAWTIFGSRLNSPSPLDHWRRRLFGPLGRSAAQKPFSPYVLESWNAALGTASRVPPMGEVADDGSTADSKVRPSSFPLGGDGNDSLSATAPRIHQDVTHEWNLVELPYGLEGLPTLTLVPKAQILAVSWAVAILCASLAVIFSRKNIQGWIVVLALACVLTLLLPSVLSTISRAASAGLLLGMLSTLVAPTSKRQRTDEAALNGSQFSPSILITAVLSVLSPSAARADNGLDSENVNYTVLIPVDRDLKPVGTQRFVSEDLLSKLYRVAGSSKQKPDVLIWGATYQAAIPDVRISRSGPGHLDCNSGYRGLFSWFQGPAAFSTGRSPVAGGVFRQFGDAPAVAG